MSKLKILHFNPLFMPFLGGAEENIYNFAKYSMHEHHIFTDLIEGTSKFEEKDNIRIHRVGPSRKSTLSYIPSEMIIDLVRELNKAVQLGKIDYDVLHLHATYLAPRISIYVDEKLGHTIFKQLAAWKLNKKPIVVTFHNLPSDDSQKNSIQSGFATSRAKNSWKGIEKTLCKKARCIVCVDRYMTNVLSQIFSTKKIIHVPSGVDVELNQPMNRDKAFKNLPLEIQNSVRKSAFRILYIGRVEINKGVYFLNSICDQLPENATLVIAGHGNLKLLRKSKKIVYLGPVKNSLIPYLINCCDVVLNTTVVQGIGRQTFEAMASRKPVIMLNYGDRYPLEHNQNGFLVNDVDEALDVIHGLQHDSCLKNSLSQNALATAQKYSVQNMAKVVDDAYQYCVDT